MADISKITLPNKASYNIKDATARSEISKLKTNVTMDGKTIVFYFGETVADKTLIFPQLTSST